jgi:hypothetical protein
VAAVQDQKVELLHPAVLAVEEMARTPIRKAKTDLLIVVAEAVQVGKTLQQVYREVAATAAAVSSSFE